MGKQCVIKMILICFKLDSYSEDVGGLISSFSLDASSLLTREHTGRADTSWHAIYAAFT